MIKTIYTFSLYLIISLAFSAIGCSNAKHDLDSQESEAQKYFLASDYKNAEFHFREKLKIASSMGWTNTQLYTLISIAEMESFQKNTRTLKGLILKPLRSAKAAKNVMMK